MKDHYRILGVPPAATLTQVKSAYRKKASELHPDRNPSAQAHGEFQDVQEAYELLSDQARRKDYDDNRRRSLIENPIETAREIWGNYLKGVLR